MREIKYAEALREALAEEMRRDARVLGLDLHWLYRKLNALSPFSHNGEFEYSLTAGKHLTVFKLQTPRGEYRFGTPICYEDATPYVIRNYVWGGARRRVRTDARSGG